MVGPKETQLDKAAQFCRSRAATGKSVACKSGDPIIIAQDLDPETEFFHYDENGSIILHDSFDLTDPSWGLRFELNGKVSVIVGRTSVMIGLFHKVSRLNNSRWPILIQGASGTGKELFGKAIASQRPGAFIAINCAYEPEALLESKLFGHVKGAFTSASTDRQGLFVAADRGTLFLDEIGDMPLSMQGRLLRVIQDGEVTPVGADKPHSVDVRLICATNRDIKLLVRQEHFREDLYYRIKALCIQVPPLCERKEDIPHLVAYFLLKARSSSKRQITRIPWKTLQRLRAYHWPGNIRELEGMLEAPLLFGDGPVLKPEEVVFDSTDIDFNSRYAPPAVASRFGVLGDSVLELTRRIMDLLQKHSYRSVEMAPPLGRSQRTVQRALRELMAKGEVVRKRGKDGRFIEYYPADNPPSD